MKPAVAELLRRALLLTPITLVYLTIFLGGLLMIVLTSLGFSSEHLTGTHYREVLASRSIGLAAARTLRVSMATVVICLLLGFPVARYLADSVSRWKSLVMMCVLSPLMVSAIGRLFGWMAFFGPGSWISDLMTGAFGMRATGLLYTEPAMVIGLVNVLLPFMVLSISASRSQLDTTLLQAASSLGASDFDVLRKVELPLSIPGILSGCLLVFALSISNFVTAALLGGSGNDVVAYRVYVDTLIYFQQSAGAAEAVLLMLFTVAIMLLAIHVGNRGAVYRSLDAD